MKPNLLILGGTSEASALAKAVSEAGIEGVFSYAGRVEQPRPQPLPIRTGGFGGVDGLANWLRENAVSHVIDATHPFAAQMSRNAIAACQQVNIPLIALTRAPWVAQAGDCWQHVPDITAAVRALEGARQRVMLAIGRMYLESFAPLRQHFYLLRLVDVPGALPFPEYAVEVSRGPFTLDGDRALMERHAIDFVVSKNAGGSAARAKIDAARELGIPVLMIDRPALPDRHETHEVQDVMRWLSHTPSGVSGTDLGV
ncbi:MAG: cobalt-precorrin-6A reductase [Heliomarina sp.]|uniref:cobalt-precorrin-6A reductase n=1 Tax=Heliomarina sp. TaxID=2917556 RepID=UPI004059D27B